MGLNLILFVVIGFCTKNKIPIGNLHNMCVSMYNAEIAP
jgi:hypothetical protein